MRTRKYFFLKKCNFVLKKAIKEYKNIQYENIFFLSVMKPIYTEIPSTPHGSRILPHKTLQFRATKIRPILPIIPLLILTKANKNSIQSHFIN